MLAPIEVGSEIVGTTQVVGWRRVWARRRTDFRVSADVWPAQHGWSFRVLDHAGRDLLHARLEPGTSATTAAM